MNQSIPRAQKSLEHGVCGSTHLARVLLVAARADHASRDGHGCRPLEEVFAVLMLPGGQVCLEQACRQSSVLGVSRRKLSREPDKHLPLLMNQDTHLGDGTVPGDLHPPLALHHGVVGRGQRDAAHGLAVPERHSHAQDGHVVVHALGAGVLEDAVHGVQAAAVLPQRRPHAHVVLLGVGAAGLAVDPQEPQERRAGRRA